MSTTLPNETAAQKRDREKSEQLVPKKRNAWALLQEIKPSIQAVLPRHLTPDRMAMIAFTAMQKTPKLLECTRESIIGSIMTASMLGLEPSGPIGHGALIPYWNSRTKSFECQFQPMYQGLLDLARRSGMIKDVQVRAVLMGDQYSYRYGLDPDLTHVPLEKETTIANVTYRADDPNRPPVAVYAVVRFTNGGLQWDQMSYAAAIAHGKRYSPSWDASLPNGGAFKAGSVWADNPLAMCLKTILKIVLKLCPKSPEMAAALMMDDLADVGKMSTMKRESDGVFTVDFSEDDPAHQAAADDARRQVAATSALDGIVQNETTKAPAEAAAAEKKEEPPAKPAGPVTCDKSDMDQLEILATENGVLQKAWKEHVQKTMGFSSWDLLTKDRLEEVRKWIIANAKPAK